MRVGIRFESGDRAGEEGEAILGQLIAPWEEAPAIQAEEDALDRLAEVIPTPIAGHQDAIHLMLEVNANSQAVDAVYGGVVLPEDVLDELAGRAEMSPDELRQSPSFVAMDGRVVVALRTAHRLATSIAKREPLQTLEWVEDFESSSRLVRQHYGPSLDEIRRWTGVGVDELKLARAGAEEQERLRRALIDVRQTLGVLAGEIDRLASEIDGLLDPTPEEHPGIGE